MPAILTVHGTFASGPETGKDWWQKGSSFESQLRELVEAENGQLSYQPIIWDGANSETSRRDAGAALFGKIQALEASNEPYCVIGHSHGGSVIANTLIDSAGHKNPLNYLKAWLTIGTPFITTQKEQFLFNRLGVFGKSVFVALITAAMLLILNDGLDAFDFASIESATFSIGSLFYICLPFIIFYITMRAMELWKHSRYNKKTIAFTSRAFAPRWLALWHINDEAVQGLKSLKTLDFKIFSKGFVVGPLSFVSIFALPLVVLIMLNSPGTMTQLWNGATTIGYDRYTETD